MNGNGFTKWVVGITATLFTIGAVGGVKVYAKQERDSQKIDHNTEEIHRNAVAIKEMSNKLTVQTELLIQIHEAVKRIEKDQER